MTNEKIFSIMGEAMSTLNIAKKDKENITNDDVLIALSVKQVDLLKRINAKLKYMVVFLAILVTVIGGFAIRWLLGF